MSALVYAHALSSQHSVSECWHSFLVDEKNKPSQQLEPPCVHIAGISWKTHHHCPPRHKTQLPRGLRSGNKQLWARKPGRHKTGCFERARQHMLILPGDEVSMYLLSTNLSAGCNSEPAQLCGYYAVDSWFLTDMTLEEPTPTPKGQAAQGMYAPETPTCQCRRVAKHPVCLLKAFGSHSAQEDAL